MFKMTRVCCIYLQVLWGDVDTAIHIHDMLYHVMERHNFLPEAFTHDFRVHWGNHPLRPEFIESTYFLYKVHRHVCVGCVGVCVWGDGGGCVCVGWVGVHGIQVMAAEKNN